MTDAQSQRTIDPDIEEMERRISDVENLKEALLAGGIEVTPENIESLKMSLLRIGRAYHRDRARQ